MKKRFLAAMACSMSLMLMAGCVGQSSGTEIITNDSDMDASAQVQEDSADSASSETAVDGATGNIKLSASECEAEIDKLLQTEEVKPDNEEILNEMVHCVAVSCVLEFGDGMVFSEMENRCKAFLRRRIIEDVFLQNDNPFSGAIKLKDGDENSATMAVPVDEAVALFKDVYGEENFTPFETEQVKDDFMPFTFSDGEPWNSIEHMKYYEDEGYYLITGPGFYSDNSGDTSFLGYADILIAKNPKSRYGVTLLYGRYRDESIKVTSVETSSELQPAGGKTYGGMNLVDRDYTTVWAEGVQGTGVGETIVLHLDKKQPVCGVMICNGYTENDELFTANGTVTKANVDFGDNNIVIGEMEAYSSDGLATEELAGMNNNCIEPKEPVETDTIIITIMGAEKGETYDDTCISEIVVY